MKENNINNLLLENLAIITCENTKDEITRLKENVMDEIYFDSVVYIESVGHDIEELQKLDFDNLVGQVFNRTLDTVSQHYKAKHNVQYKYVNNYDKYIMSYYISQIKNIKDKPQYFVKISRDALTDEKVNFENIINLRKKLLANLGNNDELFLKYWKMSENHSDIDCTYQELTDLGWDLEEILTYYKDVISIFFENFDFNNNEIKVIEDMIVSTYTNCYLIQSNDIEVIIDTIIRIIYLFDTVGNLIKKNSEQEYAHLLLVDVLANLYLCYNKLKWGIYDWSKINQSKWQFFK